MFFHNNYFLKWIRPNPRTNEQLLKEFLYSFLPQDLVLYDCLNTLTFLSFLFHYYPLLFSRSLLQKPYLLTTVKLCIAKSQLFATAHIIDFNGSGWTSITSCSSSPSVTFGSAAIYHIKNKQVEFPDISIEATFPMNKQTLAVLFFYRN